MQDNRNAIEGKFGLETMISLEILHQNFFKSFMGGVSLPLRFSVYIRKKGKRKCKGKDQILSCK